MTSVGRAGIAIIISLMIILAVFCYQFRPQATVGPRWTGTQSGGGAQPKDAAGSSTALKSAGPAARGSDGSTAGRLDDRRSYIPANYTDWSPPVLGVSFKDPTYGTLITRLSNGLAQFNGPVHHEYATISPFNKNNTRILMLTENDGFYIADLRGNVIVRPAEVNLSGASEPRWSATDPDVFYFHEYQRNEIRKYDLRTHQKSVVHTFTQYSSINFGGG